MSKKYWVLYKLSIESAPLELEKIVEINPSDGTLPDLLRAAVRPYRPGDPRDGIRPQLTSDCILLNWIAL